MLGDLGRYIGKILLERGGVPGVTAREHLGVITSASSASALSISLHLPTSPYISPCLRLVYSASSASALSASLASRSARSDRSVAAAAPASSSLRSAAAAPRACAEASSRR